jgi:hypothetical protein
MFSKLRRLMLACTLLMTLGAAQHATPCAAQSWWTVGYPPYMPAYPTRYYPGMRYDPRFAYPTRFYPSGLFPGVAYYQGYGPPYAPVVLNNMPQ